MAEQRRKEGTNEEEEDFDDDDEDGRKKRNIGPLAALDHSQIKYDEFNKNFYEEASDIAKMKEDEVNKLRKELEIQVSGFNVPKPIQNWAQVKAFDKIMLEELKKQNYTEPTSIQKQSIPVALSGRDLIAIAKTGSGKTAAFLLPIMIHIMDQRELEEGEGPIAVILAPTRELADQIYREAKKFARGYGIKSVSIFFSQSIFFSIHYITCTICRVGAIYGGVPKHEQIKALKAGVEIVVSTPGRLIDITKGKHCPMNRVTILVLDEADRMFDLGFGKFDV